MWVLFCGWECVWCDTMWKEKGCLFYSSSWGINSALGVEIFHGTLQGFAAVQAGLGSVATPRELLLLPCIPWSGEESLCATGRGWIPPRTEKKRSKAFLPFQDLTDVSCFSGTVIPYRKKEVSGGFPWADWEYQRIWVQAVLQLLKRKKFFSLWLWLFWYCIIRATAQFSHL